MMEKEFEWNKQEVANYCLWKAMRNPPKIYQNEFDAIEEYEQSKMEKVYPEGIKTFRKGEFFEAYHSPSNNYHSWCNELINDGFVIWSVQNGDDVLTIGDAVYYKTPTNQHWKIDNFYITLENTLIARSKDNILIEQVDADLKKRTPLFRSDDLKDVYDKQHIFQVYEMNNKLYCSEVISDEREFKARGKVPAALYFTSIEEAKRRIQFICPEYKLATTDNERNGLISLIYNKTEKMYSASEVKEKITKAATLYWTDDVYFKLLKLFEE